MAANAADMERDIVAAGAADMAKNTVPPTYGGSGRPPPTSPIDEAPTFEPEKPLSLLMGTGAMTHVAGCGRGALPGNVSTEGFNVRGVGGGVARSTGTGSLTITFKSGREGL